MHTSDWVGGITFDRRSFGLDDPRDGLDRGGVGTMFRIHEWTKRISVCSIGLAGERRRSS